MCSIGSLHCYVMCTADDHTTTITRTYVFFQHTTCGILGRTGDSVGIGERAEGVGVGGGVGGGWRGDSGIYE